MALVPLCLLGVFMSSALKVFLFLVASILLQIPFAFLIPRDGIILGQALNASVALGITWAAARWESRDMAFYGLGVNRRFWKELGWGFAGGAGLMLVTGLLLLALGGVRFAWNSGGRLGGLAFGLLLFALVAVGEELLFRGYPFQIIEKASKPWIAQLIMGLLFVFVHLGNPGIRQASVALQAVTLINLILAAILLGLAFLKTRSLALPIGIHWSWNWTQGNVLGFGVSGTDEVKGLLQPSLSPWPDYLTGEQVGLEGSLFCTLICVMAILFLWKRRAQEQVS